MTLEAQILEVTIRDGSYEVGQQFTIEDVTILASLLDTAGFSYIEVGHGSGLSAANIPIFAGKDISAAASDEQYMRAARRVVKNAKLGVPFFSNTAPDPVGPVRLTHACGLDFLRVI